jgi:hypothetical protein
MLSREASMQRVPLLILMSAALWCADPKPGDQIPPPSSGAAPLQVYVTLRDGSTKCGLFDPMKRTITISIGNSSAAVPLRYEDVLTWAIPTPEQIAAAAPKPKAKAKKPGADAPPPGGTVQAPPAEVPPPGEDTGIPARASDSDTQGSKAKRLALLRELKVLYQDDAPADLDALALRVRIEQHVKKAKAAEEDRLYIIDQLTERFAGHPFFAMQRQANDMSRSDLPWRMASLTVTERIKAKSYEDMSKIATDMPLDAVLRFVGLSVTERTDHDGGARAVINFRADFISRLPILPEMTCNVDVSIRKQAAVRTHSVDRGSQWLISSIAYGDDPIAEVDDYLGGAYRVAYYFDLSSGSDDMDLADNKRMSRGYREPETTFTFVPEECTWKLQTRLQKETGISVIRWKAGGNLVVDRVMNP